jgi:hypothetical protein
MILKAETNRTSRFPSNDSILPYISLPLPARRNRKANQIVYSSPFNERGEIKPTAKFKDAAPVCPNAENAVVGITRIRNAEQGVVNEGDKVISNLPSLLVIFLQSRIEILVPRVGGILRLPHRLDKWRLGLAWKIFELVHVLGSVYTL